jgi:DNA-binding response OmpR family regulator
VKSAKKVILAIDDIVPVLNVIRKILENDYAVCLAKSIKVASMMMKTNKVELILLDIEMPEMSGFDYLKQLQQMPRYSDIPVIFVTSHATEKFLIQAMSFGAKDFVVKPISPDILKGKIRGILDKEPEKTVSRNVQDKSLPVLQCVKQV